MLVMLDMSCYIKIDLLAAIFVDADYFRMA